MQKFTRNLTREIEVGGERLAVTFSAEGLSVRPVGSRKPPTTLSWAGCLCACVGLAPSAAEPSGDEVSQALAQLKGDRKRAAAPAAAGTEQTAAAPAPADSAPQAVASGPAEAPAPSPPPEAPASPPEP